MITIKKEPAQRYARRLLEKKTYFISELYQKLIKYYNQNEVNITIKELIICNEINDKNLLQLEVNNFIISKHYSLNYTYNYFIKKGISSNLIKYVLKDYSIYDFDKNIRFIYDFLTSKKREEKYIINYLLRKGYEYEDIKRVCNLD